MIGVPVLNGGRSCIILLLMLLLISCEDWPPPSETQENIDAPTVALPASPVAAPKNTLSERDLSYKGRQLILTKHARCRMDCRELDPYEIQEVINLNNINQRKSKPASGGRCESIAYEGRTRDGQMARIIVGDCEDDPIVITVIDLDTKYNCTCK
ncbi:MAG: DUF4258 domain-containing protein [Aureispira sp.]